MDIDRVRTEIGELDRHYPVKASIEKGYVMITTFGYPRGWSPRSAPLFYSLPRNYPRVPPIVYLPPDSRFQGRKVEHMLGPNDDGWWQWCVERLPWQPYGHSLYSLTEVMKQSLAQPRKARLEHRRP